MTLDWSIHKVEDWEAIADGGTEAIITDAIVFHTLAINMNRITEGNWQEFYARIRIMENYRGPSVSAPKWAEVEPHELSTDDIIRLPDESPDQLYYFEDTGFDDYIHEQVLYLSEYEYQQFGGPTKGKSVTFVIHKSGVITPIEKHDGFEKRPITPEDVKRRIGLTTNVENTGRATWSKRIMDHWINEGMRYAGRTA